MTPKMFTRQLPYYEKQLEMKRRSEQELAWINGIYVARAVGACFKGKYPDKPLDFYNVNNNTFLDVDQEEETKKPKDVVDFEAWAIAFNQKQFSGEKTTDESEVKEDG